MGDCTIYEAKTKVLISCAFICQGVAEEKSLKMVDRQIRWTETDRHQSMGILYAHLVSLAAQVS